MNKMLTFGQSAVYENAGKSLAAAEALQQRFNIWHSKLGRYEPESNTPCRICLIVVGGNLNLGTPL